MQEYRYSRPQDEWYSISVDTLRGWLVLSLLLAAAVVGYFGWRAWESYALESAAREVLDEARALTTQVQAEQDLSDFEDQLSDAFDSYQTAKEQFDRGELAPALKGGKRAVALLSSILDALRDHGTVGEEAHFISVVGRVEFRRGEHGGWEEARSRVRLRDGYYVKTADRGSAEIMFRDGTLYKVRPNTVFLVARTRTAGGVPGSQSIRLRNGRLDLNTNRRSTRVATPGAEAEVEENSSASVVFDEAADEGNLAVYQGRAQFASATGVTRNVEALQEVSQKKQWISEPKSIPRAPRLQAPGQNHEVTVEPDSQLVLAWSSVSGAARYELQVSPNDHFIDNIIETGNRRTTRATLGIRGEGSFLWRVRAINRDGSTGEWSEIWKIRARQGGSAEGDREPPNLEILPVQTYGSILIISGKTEPGAAVAVRGEPAQVDAEGAFNKTLQVYDQGWSFLDVRARDPYGNETVRPVRVYVDSL